MGSCSRQDKSLLVVRAGLGEALAIAYWSNGFNVLALSGVLRSNRLCVYSDFMKRSKITLKLSLTLQKFKPRSDHLPANQRFEDENAKLTIDSYTTWLYIV